MEHVQTEKQATEKKQYWNFREHAELIAAITSGLLILIAWVFKDNMNHTVWIALNLSAFAIGGYAKAKEGITETISNKELNVELLMFLAAIGSAAIGYWTEGALLIFIFSLSGALETYTMNKSNKEISSLMELQPEQALRISNGKEEIIPVSELEIGDLILVRASERVPADGVIARGLSNIDESVIRGETSIDESAITGESVPVPKSIDSEVYAGTVVLDGTLTIKITKPANETLFQKIIQMVQSAQEEKSPSQLFIERFESTYVKTVLAIVILMMFVPYFAFGWSFTHSIYRAMILLVVASPCALVASIMPATLSAISNSARRGILFKGGVHLENLGHVKAVALDKTGTLTNGKPRVTDFHVKAGLDKNEVAAIAGAIEKESTHPLAEAITAYGSDYSRNVQFEIEDMRTESGNGVRATVNGDLWKIGKPKYVGSEESAAFNDGIAEKLQSQGKTVVIAKRNDEIVALFALQDTVRTDTVQAIKTLKKQGIKTYMLTGDNEMTARAIAEETGVDGYIAECLPDDKVNYLKDLRKKYGHIAMIGDGINDAPALATANVGIAMGEGTDIALETADVVLMKNELSKIPDAMSLSTRMNRIVKQNMFFSVAVIALLIASNFFQAIDLPLGVIGHEGSTILVILNGLRLLK
ncbi:heavy metal translocating P-type ATPase [Aciduricibacillus chroicocephali]|uniref:Heavy metal translocating P-type ATPase n=2 Tax=Aciduricibacillus chroicocephali TaxID=3054939 RepID=A0ABY9L270_9BACI|nr:heavy metal translocating P-type ATPase [Bacillaceae bacterium 44XB]